MKLKVFKHNALSIEDKGVGNMMNVALVLSGGIGSRLVPDLPSLL